MKDHSSASPRRRADALPALAAALLLIMAPGPTSQGMTVMQASLEDLCRHAHLIFRGTVVQITSGTVAVGGGTLPVITYRLRVDESFKGSFSTLKGQRFTEITTLGKLEMAGRQGLLRGLDLALLPRLAAGGDYLLFTTRPGPTGLSTTVGLGQGCFQVAGEAGSEEAVNAYGNRGLQVHPADPSLVPPTDAGEVLAYGTLAVAVRALLAEP